MRIVKLGGSLLETAALPACLQRVTTLPGRTLLAPGGGIFAEQVRIAQREWRFDDDAAHHMAILGMQQMAFLFKSLQPSLHTFTSLNQPCDWSGAAVWFPQLIELDNAGIPAGWEITSDSLAAWLAWRLGADELLLVKSAPINDGANLTELQQQGVVDLAFPAYAERLECPLTIIDKDRFLSSHD